MTAVRKNIFLTGAPSSGKTTVIRKVVEGLGVPSKGFFTEEEKVDNRRVGFIMRTLDGGSGYLAHRDIISPYHVRHYGVSIENIELLAAPSLAPAGGDVIILDEIGKMECFSEVFRNAVLKALNSPNIVVGTVTFGGDEFIAMIKRREDIDISEVTPENRDVLPRVIIAKVRALKEKE